MGTFNTLQTQITCPHCSETVDAEIELFFGDTRQMLRPGGIAPGWQPMPRPDRLGIITYNPAWMLTPKVQTCLDQLTTFSVDIFSSRGGDDYTLLVPHGLQPKEYEQVERLLHALANAVQGRLTYVDWYPHGWKFRVKRN